MGTIFVSKGNFIEGYQLLHKVELLILETFVGFLLCQPAQI